jgi:creatinine amidohydrolase
MKCHNILLENKTWKEIEELLNKGYNKIILPIGSTEQHGPHLPLFTDTIITMEISKELACKLGKTLIAPPISVGLSEHHMYFPGTITLKKDTLKKVIEEYIESLYKHGFKYIIPFSMHGGNYPALKEIKEEFKNKEPMVIIYDDFEKLSAIFHKPAEEKIPYQLIGSHAGLVETSVILYLNEELVRRNLIVQGYIGDLQYAREKMRKEGINAVNINGILGDPRYADKEIGRRALESVVNFLYDFIEENCSECI